MHQNLVVQLFKFHWHIQFLLIGIFFFSCHSDLLNLGKNINCMKCTELINIGHNSKFYISICCQAFLVVTLFFQRNFLICWFLLLWLKTIRIMLFFMPICPSQLLSHYEKIMCYLSYSANAFITISDFQQIYVEVKTLRRTGWISNILHNKILKLLLSLLKRKRL